jgi:hypothetical protein
MTNARLVCKVEAHRTHFVQSQLIVIKLVEREEVDNCPRGNSQAGQGQPQALGGLRVEG